MLASFNPLWPLLKCEWLVLGRRAARFSGTLVARAISSPTFLLKIGVSNGAISLQYIHSRADLSVLITFSGERLFRFPFEAWGTTSLAGAIC